MNTIFRLLIALSLMLYGCSSTILEVRTNPPGALVTEMGNGLQSIAPAKFNYTWNQKAVENNCMRVKGYRATWPSGAIMSTGEIITMCGGPKTYSIDINRPSSYPGLDKDMAHALQIQQLQQQEKQANIEAWSRAIQSWNQNTTQNSNRIEMTDCTVIGNSISCMHF